MSTFALHPLHAVIFLESWALPSCLARASESKASSAGQWTKRTWHLAFPSGASGLKMSPHIETSGGVTRWNASAFCVMFMTPWPSDHITTKCHNNMLSTFCTQRCCPKHALNSKGSCSREETYSVKHDSAKKGQGKGSGKHGEHASVVEAVNVLPAHNLAV